MRGRGASAASSYKNKKETNAKQSNKAGKKKTTQPIINKRGRKKVISKPKKESYLVQHDIGRRASKSKIVTYSENSRLFFDLHARYGVDSSSGCSHFPASSINDVTDTSSALRNPVDAPIYKSPVKKNKGSHLVKNIVGKKKPETPKGKKAGKLKDIPAKVTTRSSLEESSPSTRIKTELDSSKKKSANNSASASKSKRTKSLLSPVDCIKELLTSPKRLPNESTNSTIAKTPKRPTRKMDCVSPEDISSRKNNAKDPLCVKQECDLRSRSNGNAKYHSAKCSPVSSSSLLQVKKEDTSKRKSRTNIPKTESDVKFPSSNDLKRRRANSTPPITSKSKKSNIKTVSSPPFRFRREASLNAAAVMTLMYGAELSTKSEMKTKSSPNQIKQAETKVSPKQEKKVNQSNKSSKTKTAQKCSSDSKKLQSDIRHTVASSIPPKKTIIKKKVKSLKTKKAILSKRLERELGIDPSKANEPLVRGRRVASLNASAIINIVTMSAHNRTVLKSTTESIPSRSGASTPSTTPAQSDDSPKLPALKSSKNVAKITDNLKHRSSDKIKSESGSFTKLKSDDTKKTTITSPVKLKEKTVTSDSKVSESNRLDESVKLKIDKTPNSPSSSAGSKRSYSKVSAVVSKLSNEKNSKLHITCETSQIAATKTTKTLSMSPAKHSDNMPLPSMEETYGRRTQRVPPINPSVYNFPDSPSNQSSLQPVTSATVSTAGNQPVTTSISIKHQPQQQRVHPVQPQELKSSVQQHYSRNVLKSGSCKAPLTAPGQNPAFIGHKQISPKKSPNKRAKYIPLTSAVVVNTQSNSVSNSTGLSTTNNVASVIGQSVQLSSGAPRMSTQSPTLAQNMLIEIKKEQKTKPVQDVQPSIRQTSPAVTSPIASPLIQTVQRYPVAQPLPIPSPSQRFNVRSIAAKSNSKQTPKVVPSSNEIKIAPTMLQQKTFPTPVRHSPVKLAPQSAVGPMKLDSQSAVAPMKIAPQSAVSPVKLAPQSEAGPGKFGHQSAVGPGRLGHQSAVGPVKLAPQSAVSPVKFGPQSAVGPGKLGSQSAVSPVKLAPQSAISPVKLAPHSAVGPGKLGSQSAISPVKFAPQSAISPVKFAPQSAISPVKLAPPSTVGPRSILPTPPIRIQASSKDVLISPTKPVPVTTQPVQKLEPTVSLTPQFVPTSSQAVNSTPTQQFTLILPSKNNYIPQQPKCPVKTIVAKPPSASTDTVKLIAARPSTIPSPNRPQPVLQTRSPVKLLPSPSSVVVVHTPSPTKQSIQPVSPVKTMQTQPVLHQKLIVTEQQKTVPLNIVTPCSKSPIQQRQSVSSSIVSKSPRTSPSIKLDKKSDLNSLQSWIWVGEPFEKVVFTESDAPPLRQFCYKSIRHQKDGMIMHVYDSVLLRTDQGDLPYVAKITAFYEDIVTGVKMMALLWYYRPEHTEQGRQAWHVDADLYASRHRDKNPVACIEDRAYVLPNEAYARFMAEWRRREEGADRGTAHFASTEDTFPSDMTIHNVFLCRGVYDFKQRRLIRRPSFVHHTLSKTSPSLEHCSPKDDNDDERDSASPDGPLMIADDPADGSMPDPALLASPLPPCGLIPRGALIEGEKIFSTLKNVSVAPVVPSSRLVIPVTNTPFSTQDKHASSKPVEQKRTELAAMSTKLNFSESPLKQEMPFSKSAVASCATPVSTEVGHVLNTASSVAPGNVSTSPISTTKPLLPKPAITSQVTGKFDSQQFSTEASKTGNGSPSISSVVPEIPPFKMEALGSPTKILTDAGSIPDQLKPVQKTPQPTAVVIAKESISSNSDDSNLTVPIIKANQLIVPLPGTTASISTTVLNTVSQSICTSVRPPVSSLVTSNFDAVHVVSSTFPAVQNVSPEKVSETVNNLTQLVASSVMQSSETKNTPISLSTTPNTPPTTSMVLQSSTAVPVVIPPSDKQLTTDFQSCVPPTVSDASKLTTVDSSMSASTVISVPNSLPTPNQLSTNVQLMTKSPDTPLTVNKVETTAPSVTISSHSSEVKQLLESSVQSITNVASDMTSRIMATESNSQLPQPVMQFTTAVSTVGESVKQVISNITSVPQTIEPLPPSLVTETSTTKTNNCVQQVPSHVHSTTESLNAGSQSMSPVSQPTATICTTQFIKQSSPDVEPVVKSLQAPLEKIPVSHSIASLSVTQSPSCTPIVTQVLQQSSEEAFAPDVIKIAPSITSTTQMLACVSSAQITASQTEASKIGEMRSSLQARLIESTLRHDINDGPSPFDSDESDEAITDCTADQTYADKVNTPPEHHKEAAPTELINSADSGSTLPSISSFKSTSITDPLEQEQKTANASSVTNGDTS